MALEDDIAFFERVPTFASLGKAALRILAIGVEPRRMQNGAVLFYAGDVTDSAYLVLEGAMTIEPATADRDQEYNVGPGTLLLEPALLIDTVCPMTVTAAESSTVFRIPRSLFMKMLEAHPAAAKKMRDNMAQRVDAWSHELLGVKRAMDRDDDYR